MDIQKQRQYLHDRFEVCRLHDLRPDQATLDGFRGDEAGENLAIYLRECGWTADVQGDTRIYLVLDRITGEIVYYFGLACGMMYQPYGLSMLPETEQLYVKSLADAMLSKKNRYIRQVLKSGNKIYQQHEMDLFFALAAEYSYALEDRASTNEEKISMPVKKAFPAVEITHFCKNAAYHAPMKLDFPLGVWVYWDLIVPELLEISAHVAVNHIYLFAADQNVHRSGKDDSRLIRYYENELQFERVDRKMLIKQAYDFHCVSMSRSSLNLRQAREVYWLSHNNL